MKKSIIVITLENITGAGRDEINGGFIDFNGVIWISKKYLMVQIVQELAILRKIPPPTFSKLPKQCFHCRVPGGVSRAPGGGCGRIAFGFSPLSF